MGDPLGSPRVAPLFGNRRSPRTIISRNALLNEQEVLDRLTFFSLSFSLGLFHLSDFRYFVKHNNI